MGMVFAQKLVHLSSEPWDLHPLILLGSVAAWNTPEMDPGQALPALHQGIPCCREWKKTPFRRRRRDMKRSGFRRPDASMFVLDGTVRGFVAKGITVLRSRNQPGWGGARF